MATATATTQKQRRQKGQTAFLAVTSAALWMEVTEKQPHQRTFKRVADETECFLETCKNKAKDLCGKCRAARYCSTECQKLHWKEHGHKDQCLEPHILQCVLQEDVRGCELLLQKAHDECQKLVREFLKRLNTERDVPQAVMEALKASPAAASRIQEIMCYLGGSSLSEKDLDPVLEALLLDFSPAHCVIRMDDGTDEKQQVFYRPLIHFAVATGNLDLVQVFAKHGCDLMQPDSDGQNAIEVLLALENTRQMELKTKLELHTRTP